MLVTAQKDFARFKSLADKSFATQQNLDLQQAKVALAAGDHHAGQEHL